MSLGQRFERRLEGMVGSAFARVFKGQVEPVEIGSALQREAGDKKAVMGSGQVLSPNRYRVTLGPSDYERFAPWEVQLANSLAELVQEYLDENNLSTIGDVEVYLAKDDNLRTGVFGVASRMEPQALPRRRPHDSMSMPVIPGRPDEYQSPYGASSPDFNPPPTNSPPTNSPPTNSPPVNPPPAPHGPPTTVQPPYVESPRRPSFRAQLIVDGTQRAVELKVGSNIVGRGTGCDLQLIDQGVSRRHLDVRVAQGRAVADDLGSTNGTTVNGHRVQSQQLQHGDVIRVGHSRLVYQQEANR